MWGWVKNLFGMPEPAGPAQLVKKFTTDQHPLAKDMVAEGDAWKIGLLGGQVLTLYEIHNPGVEQCMLAYRARIRTQDCAGRVYLEMWCRLPGGGEYFSKGYHHALKGSNDWVACETPFYLKAGQRPDLIRLNLAMEGAGTAWVSDLELLQTPLK